MGATRELTPLNPDVGHAALVPTTEKPHASRVRPEHDRKLRESSARLDKLPHGLEFPSRLRQRIAFDPCRGRLSYYGFMTKGDYDLLRGLTGDTSYQQALEQLFRKSSVLAFIDIGIDQVLDDNDSACRASPVMWRWVLPWSVMIACVAGASVLVWWLLHSLR